MVVCPAPWRDSAKRAVGVTRSPCFRPMSWGASRAAYQGLVPGLTNTVAQNRPLDPIELTPELGIECLAPTPRSDGFSVPPEWYPHQRCFMAWPTRLSLWGERFDQAKTDYASVARTIAGFEPVVMICCPGDAREVRNRCGSEVEAVEIEIDDSWTRDNGPIFVVNARGELAIVDFGFNGWGEKYHPYDRDADLSRALADLLGAKRYRAPFVLEGGAFFVDGEGTLVTTEGPLLNSRRNPAVTMARVEEIAYDYLGIDCVVWLVAAPDRDTDGHVDCIAQYVRPGALLLLTPSDPDHPNFGPAGQNEARLATARDARGRTLEIVPFEITGSGTTGAHDVEIPYLNCYLANGAVVTPLAGGHSDEAALERLREVFPGREVVGVPGSTLSYGGGGPHYITQQMPVGNVVAP
jgi:agmatine deiminase